MQVLKALKEEHLTVPHYWLTTHSLLACQVNDDSPSDPVVVQEHLSSLPQAELNSRTLFGVSELRDSSHEDSLVTLLNPRFPL